MLLHAGRQRFDRTALRDFMRSAAQQVLKAGREVELAVNAFEHENNVAAAAASAAAVNAVTSASAAPSSSEREAVDNLQLNFERERDAKVSAAASAAINTMAASTASSSASLMNALTSASTASTSSKEEAEGNPQAAEMLNDSDGSDTDSLSGSQGTTSTAVVKPLATSPSSTAPDPSKAAGDVDALQRSDAQDEDEPYEDGWGGSAPDSASSIDGGEVAGHGVSAGSTRAWSGSLLTAEQERAAEETEEQSERDAEQGQEEERERAAQAETYRFSGLTVAAELDDVQAQYEEQERAAQRDDTYSFSGPTAAVELDDVQAQYEAEEREFDRQYQEEDRQSVGQLLRGGGLLVTPPPTSSANTLPRGAGGVTQPSATAATRWDSGGVVDLQPLEDGGLAAPSTASVLRWDSSGVIELQPLEGIEYRGADPEEDSDGEKGRRDSDERDARMLRSSH